MLHRGCNTSVGLAREATGGGSGSYSHVVSLSLCPSATVPCWSPQSPEVQAGTTEVTAQSQPPLPKVNWLPSLDLKIFLPPQSLNPTCVCSGALVCKGRGDLKGKPCLYRDVPFIYSRPRPRWPHLGASGRHKRCGNRRRAVQ